MTDWSSYQGRVSHARRCGVINLAVHLAGDVDQLIPISAIPVTAMRPENTATLFEFSDQPKGIGPANPLQQSPGSVASKGGAQQSQDLIINRTVPKSFSIGVAAGTRSLRDIYHDVNDSSIDCRTTMHSIISHRVLHHIISSGIRQCRSDTESSEDGESDVEEKFASLPRNIKRIINPSSRYEYMKSPCPGARSAVESVTNVRMSCLPNLQPQYLMPI